jgi:phenylpropionate dioxygenase-like ring-hydroxylating dioxygenase large terminal subunit
VSDSLSSAGFSPPQGKGQSTVARVPNAWYVVCRARDLRDRPLARTVLGIPMVLFRDGGGEAAALLDRCPHRGVPLSLGRVEDGQLECSYHGWRFDTEGVVRRVPALCAAHEAKGRCTPAYPVRELDGFVWVWPDTDAVPDVEPFRFPHLDDPRYSSVYDVVEAEGSLHAVAENALDVPHTAFLHRGLFRGDGKRNRIEVVVRRWHDRVEAEYIGEPRPPGLAGRLLAPGGGRLPIPHWFVKLVARPVGRRIFAQDARLLVKQTDAAV